MQMVKPNLGSFLRLDDCRRFNERQRRNRMETTNIKAIKNLATQFRKAIERCDLKNLPVTFDAFPLGSCGDTCILLGKWLEQNGYEDFDYVVGEREERSHAWLEKNGIIVDITADQFDDKLPTVIVSHDHSWHSQFIEDERYPVADEWNVPDNLTQFEEMYNYIIRFVEEIE